ncbi:MAG TPA: D-alanine--D-alanine ligase [Candidatus Saccharimonadales bacterium]|nr:D-alanine--D-alanine ligase [Candidatus Saccharimonadales bacterium]
MKIVVLAGGDSSEREVSLRSGSAVQAALEASGHQAEIIDPSVRALDASLSQDFDVAFPIIHGKGGEDGALQQELEQIGLPYVGSGVAASRLCFHKWDWRQFVGPHDIPLAEGDLVDVNSIWKHQLATQPFVLKPIEGGSSIDTVIVRDAGELPEKQLREVLAKHRHMLIEQLIAGTEITIGLLGDKALPVIEIIPPVSGEFDYENKYNGASQELCPPAHVSETIQKAAQTLAETVHRLCGCRDLSRTDMIVTPQGDLVVLEVNTLPGMTDQSLLPKAAAEAGIAMPELCGQLAQMAYDRQG